MTEDGGRAWVSLALEGSELEEEAESLAEPDAPPL